MIKREFYKERNDGVKLYKTYSDENYRIRKVGTDEIYDEVKKIDHRISRGTVYRNLAILSDDEEISHYNSPFGPDQTAKFTKK